MAATTREQQEIVNTFKGMQADLRALARKVNELEMELDEHKYVISPFNGEKL